MSKKSDRDDDVSAGPTLARLERLSRLIRSASQTEGLNAAQWEALRYLARANSFSNSPGALARYLGATKGTTSQTVMALIKKAAIVKTSRGDDARSVVLTLTEAGQEILNDDPLLGLEKNIDKLGDKTAKRFAKGLAEILDGEIKQQGEPSFGNCSACAHASKKQGEVNCSVFHVNVSANDMALFCVHHQAKA